MEARRTSHSYGVICWYWDVSCGWRICLVQRRVSYALCSFVDGRYKTDADWQALLRGMTSDELLLVRVGDYKSLYIHVWLSDPESTIPQRHILDRYIAHRDKFMTYFGRNNFKKLQRVIDGMRISSYNHLWGIPKGHKEPRGESDLQTALREFNEETDVSLNNIRLVCAHGRPAITLHSFVGSDGVKYNYTFYNAVYIGAGPPDSARVTHSYEIKNIVWAPIPSVKLLAPDIYRKVCGANRAVNMYVSLRPSLQLQLKTRKVSNINKNSRSVRRGVNNDINT